MDWKGYSWHNMSFNTYGLKNSSCLTLFSKNEVETNEVSQKWKNRKMENSDFLFSKKCFLFHVKSYFSSEDINIFVLTFL